MLSKIRRSCRNLLLSGTVAMADVGSSVDIIESSLGDRIEISAIPNTRTPPHIIEVCLIDGSDGGAKGFDIRLDQLPRYVTHDHKPACAELFAGAHQLVFWRSSLGQFQAVISMPLNLSGRSNERLRVIWQEDGVMLGPAAIDPHP